MSFQNIPVLRQLDRSGPEASAWLLFQNGKLLLPEGDTLYWPQEHLVQIESKPQFHRILGEFQGQIVGVAEVSDWSLPHTRLGLRKLFGQITDAERNLLSYAAQLLHWWREFSYCSHCGGSLNAATTEHFKACGGCQRQYYPRIDPCIIVLIYSGDKLLLVRSSRHTAGMYSTVAGFIEPGETIEQAVAREVLEETGVQIYPPRYMASQSWPFPRSLMLGFLAEYHSGELRVDRDELEEGRWFKRDELPLLPPAYTMSRQLIEQWFAEQGK